MSKKLKPEDYYAILLRGAEDWNRWRFQNPNISPELYKCDLSNRDLTRMTLNNVGFVSVNLTSSDFSNSNLDDSLFHECDISNSKFIRSSCKRIKFFNSTINFSDLSYSDFELSEFISCNSKKSIFKNVSFHKADLSGCDFSESDFTDSIFILANLRGTNLIKSRFSKCRFHQAQLNGAGLTCCSFNKSELSNTNLSLANLQEAHLTECNLEESILVETNLSKSKFENCSIYGISAWNLNLHKSEQNNLKITKNSEPSIFVDNLEVAQFIHLLLTSVKIRDVINTVANKAVLILGRFTQSRKLILEFIRDQLKKYGYVPIIFDFDKPLGRDYTETVTILAGLSKFIIADLTSPKSVPQESQAIIPNFNIPFIPLIHASENPYSMFKDLQMKYDWVLPVLEYRDVIELEANFYEMIIKKAEEKMRDIISEKK